MMSTVSTLGSSSAEARAIARQEASASRADAGMAEVLRLIRVSLLLRLTPAVFGAIVALASGVPNSWALGLLLIQPSLIVFIAASIIARGGNVSARQVRLLLAFTVSIYTFEFVAMTAVSLITSGVAWPLPGRPLTDEDLRQVSTSAPIPLFFLLIPAVLGARVDGRRGWWKWAGVLIVLAAFAALSIGRVLPSASAACCPMQR
jgi:hypothetical protein